MAKILCIDDDHYLTDLLCYGLAREGFEVLIANSGREGLRLARAERFDLVILDVNIPDMNGFKVLAALRAFSAIPVVMLTARAQDEDVIAGFGGGADDYVAKPFSMQVLATRVKAVLRRSAPRAVSIVQEGGQLHRMAWATLDGESNELVAHGTPGVAGTGPGARELRVRLTPTESRILQLLLAHEGQVLSAERIVERIWGYNSDSGAAVVKTHIRHLREKIERLPGRPRPIRTVPGLGYMAASGHEGDGDDASEEDDRGYAAMPRLRTLA